MDQRSGDGRFSGRFKTIAINSGYWFPGIWSSKIPTSRIRSVWRNWKPEKRIGFFVEDRSLSSSTTIFDSLVLMIPFLTTLIFSQSLFATMMFRNSTRDGMKFYCLWQRSHLMTSWKVCTNFDFVSLINSNPYWNCATWQFIKKISMPNCPKLKTVKRSIDQNLRLRNFDARNERVETEAWFRAQRSPAAKPTPKTAPSFEPPTPRGRSRSASRKRSLRGRSPSGRPIDSRAKTSSKVALNYRHPPECQFCKSESGWKSGKEFSFPHRKVEEQPNKKPKKGVDKSAVATVKDVQQLGFASQDIEPPESSAILRKCTKVLGPVRWVRFTKTVLRQSNIQENKAPSLKKKTSQTSSSAQSLRSEIWGQISGRKLKDRSNVPAETRGNLPRISISSKKRTKLNSFHLPMSEVCGRIHNNTGGKRVCGGLQSKHAYGQQERPQRCRIGYRKSLSKYDDGCNSQRRGAKKRRGNKCMSKNWISSWQSSSVTRKTLQRSRV